MGQHTPVLAPPVPVVSPVIDQPLLRIEDLSVHFPTEDGLVRAVRGVSFNLARGRKLGVVGESGSGKTTTALAIMRMIKEPGRIAAGRILLEDTDIVGLSMPEVRARRLRQMSYIPQGAMNSLNPILKIGKQLVDGMIDHGEPGTMRDFEAHAREVLVSVGLSASVADMYPHELSGGMKQRVCIAIGIILSPQLLIADEPTSALDVITQRQVMDTLGQAQERLGASLIMIGHDMGLMAQFVDDLIVMKDGKIVEAG
ncbi:MAG: ABC transporter ATP-binding protein, partial [Pseudomonadota bacterium]